MLAIPYILQVQLCIALFWIVYRLFLRGSGAFAHNRAYLLGMVALSFAVPALSIPVWPSAPVAQGTVGVGDLTAWLMVVEEAETAGAAVSWQSVAAWIAGVGMLFMLAGVARHLVRMARSLRRSEVVPLGKARIVRHEKIVAPYSFFNYIFVGEKEARSREFPQIVAHEMAHVRLGHSYDSVLAQAMLILFWWNPFVWLWNRSLKEVHEYQADAAVLNQGFDSKQYITLLIGTLADIHPEFVSAFSYSLLKNRLLMMTRKKGRYASLRLLAALPILAGTLMLFSFTEKPAEPVVPVQTPPEQRLHLEATISYPDVETTAPGTQSMPASATTVRPATQPQTPPPGEEPFVIVEEMPKFQDNGITEFRTWVQKQVNYPREAMEKNIQGRVLAEFIVEKDGSVNEVRIQDSPDQILSNEATRVISTSPQWTPGKQRGQTVRVKFLIPVDFVLHGGSSLGSAPAALANSGDIEISGNPTITVNGKAYTGGMENISGAAIASIDVIKNDPAYPEGLIEVTLKDGNERPTPAEVVVIGYGTVRKEDVEVEGRSDAGIFFRSRSGENIAPEDQPLFIIDGKTASAEELNALDPRSIESMTVLKATADTEKYGELGKNGVIIIELKK